MCTPRWEPGGPGMPGGPESLRIVKNRQECQESSRIVKNRQESLRIVKNRQESWGPGMPGPGGSGHAELPCKVRIVKNR